MNNPIDFYDIYDYYYTPLLQTTWFQITIGVIATLIIISLIIFLILRKKTKQQAPWEWALGELKKFSIEKIESKNDFKQFYFGLTRIIKTYLHKQFNLKTLDKTDEELILLLHRNKLDPNLISMIQKTAEGAVWIKYANEAALRSQAENDLKATHELITKTKEVSQ